jgi:methyl-accepting chemotaxis protein
MKTKNKPEMDTGSLSLKVKSGLNVKDKLCAIGIDLDDMAENLRRMFGSISYTSETLNNSSSELADISDQISSNTEYLNGYSHAIAAAAEELNDKRINQFDTIANTITEIAEQANLLALNATIEAGRAEEAWKGFMVIANEIKEMAKQTAEAPMEMWQEIEYIRGSTRDTVSKIEQISKVINQINDIVETINISTQEQSSTSSEIAKNVTQASIGIQKITENLV